MVTLHFHHYSVATALFVRTRHSMGRDYSALSLLPIICLEPDMNITMLLI